MLKTLTVALALLTSTTLLAAPKIYLVTVAAGPDIQSAFGHAGLEVENIPEGVPAEQMPAARSRNIVYEFGAPQLSNLLATQNIPLILGALLDESVPTREVRRTRLAFDRYYSTRNRAITRDELALTPQTAEALAQNLRATFTDTTYTYFYKNFSDNCATQLRDHILAALSATMPTAPAVAAAANTQSFEQIAADEITAAAQASSTGTIAILPLELSQHPQALFIEMALQNLGIPLTVQTGQEFFTALRGLNTQFADQNSMLFQMASQLEDTQRQALQTAMGNYITKIESTPASTAEAAFTPRRLRSLLMSLGLIGTNLLFN